MRRVLTKHAIRRFRRRIDRRATDDQVQAEIDAGELRDRIPDKPSSTAQYRYDVVGFVVTGRAVFPMCQGRLPGELVARTVLRRARPRSKAERRAWREAQREAQL